MKRTDLQSTQPEQPLSIPQDMSELDRRRPLSNGLPTQFLGLLGST